MTVEVGGAGTLGLAFETTLGTYIAPTKWIPIRSESLELMEDKVWRKNLRGKADITGAIQGYLHVEGEVEFEVTADYLLYFLYASRATPAKAGAGPYTYTFTPAHVAKATTGAGPTTRKTLSVLATRGGNPMAYTGLSVGQLAFTVDAGVLICTASMIGVSESAQASAAATYPVSDPYGPGKVTLEIPNGTPRADVATMTLNINDNLVAANRLNGSRNAAYQNWGEREVTLTCEADFDTLTDFTVFTAQTFQTAELLASNDPSDDEVSILLNATVEEAYKINLAGLGEVNKASLNFHGIFDTTDAYTTTVKTNENIT